MDYLKQNVEEFIIVTLCHKMVVMSGSQFITPHFEMGDMSNIETFSSNTGFRSGLHIFNEFCPLSIDSFQALPIFQHGFHYIIETW